MNIKIPVSWLRDYLKTDIAAKTLAKELTLRGPSVDRIDKKGDDYIWDVEVTTNRIDALSVFGIAREANAILQNLGEKSKLHQVEGLEQKLEPETKNRLNLDIKIRNYNLCPRFTTIVLDNVKIQSSPQIVKNRLEALNIRPINNIVDITNYVMLEMGQPMHAFDYDKVLGSKMTLRASTEGESIKTLDGKKRALPKGTIVIEDAKRLIDLCGIMGGENSQITKRTKRVIMFAQIYDAQTIRKTTQALAFRTDAASRFEKGPDPENILDVLKRAVYLSKKFSGAKIASELFDIYKQPKKPTEIRLNLNKLERYLGTKIDSLKAENILKSLGFKTSSTQAYLGATPPSWRSQDVTDDVDLIEEIARINGYHTLNSTLPGGEVPKTDDGNLKVAQKIKNDLIFLGLNEVVTYSIISKDLLKTTGIEEKNAVELENPLTWEWQFMRPTIIPSLLEVLANNKNLNPTLKIFEVANTFDHKLHGLPQQDLKIAFALQDSSFSEIKGLTENLFYILKRKPKFEKFKEDSTLAEKSQSAFVSTADEFVGEIGLINPKAAQIFELENNVAVAELNLTKILSQPQISTSYHQIPKFPPVIEDISAIFSTKITVETIIDEIKNASNLARKIEVIDIFGDEKIGQDKKSIAVRIWFQKPGGTPSQVEVESERNKIIKSLSTKLLAKVRR